MSRLKLEVCDRLYSDPMAKGLAVFLRCKMSPMAQMRSAGCVEQCPSLRGKAEDIYSY